MPTENGSSSRRRSRKRRSKAAAPKSTPAAQPTYNHPVPGPNEIIARLEQQGVPQSLANLVTAFKLSDARQQQSLQKQLQQLALAGRLLQNRREEWCLLAKLDAITGKVAAHRDGFGFLIPDSGGDDVYLPFHEMRQLLDGDRVAVRVEGTDRKGRRQGVLVEILERGKQTVVGQFHSERGVSYVIEAAAKSPHHFLVAPKDTGGARHGQMVKLEIVAYPSKRSEAQGRVIEVFGAVDDPGMLTTLAIESFGLRTGWPREVEDEAAAWGGRVRSKDKSAREDLRAMPLVTIDGADARDFDDAVFAEPQRQGWRLVVAIADVSHYVAKDAPLDIEARKRGTSTYFPDRVVPMLPEALSNGLCSLNPKVDRLCLVCDMQVSAQGNVEQARFYQAVMRSHARLTYEQVALAVVERDPKVCREVQAVLPHLQHLHDVYGALAKERARRGALDLELPEVRIIMGDDDSVEKVAPTQRNDAHRMIEECMIAANVQAARFLQRHKLPALYRVHPKPDPERFEELRLKLQELGLKVPAEAGTKTHTLNKILVSLQGRPDYAVLATSVLRTLSQAVYQPGNEGHFGLALDAYAHFTSPIRRYPDLLVHRGIAHLAAGGKPGAFAYGPADMEQLGRSSSMLERQAEAASRHVEARYKCVYISQHVGSDFAGVVTGVTHFGLFVMLQDLYVEGLVHVSNLKNDYYHAEHGGLRLRGERTGLSYGLGDSVWVKVTRVAVDEAKVDLMLIEPPGPEAEAPADTEVPKRKSRRRRRR